MITNTFKQWESKINSTKRGRMSNAFSQSCKFNFQTLTFNRLQQNTKLQVLFLRANKLRDDDVKQICHVLKPDPANPHSLKPLKVLDLSYNPITAEAVNSISEMLDVNRNLEYIGLAKCHLDASHAAKLFEHIGRIPFP